MNRFKAAWHVLQGKPIMWKMRLVNGIQLQPDSNDVLIADCHFIGDSSKAALTVVIKETDGREESGPLEI